MGYVILMTNLIWCRRLLRLCCECCIILKYRVIVNDVRIDNERGVAFAALMGLQSLS